MGSSIVSAHARLLGNYTPDITSQIIEERESLILASTVGQ